VVEGKELLRVIPFLSNALVVVAPPSHPLAGRAALPTTALGQEEFVVREQGSGTRRDMEELFRAAGVTLRSDWSWEVPAPSRETVAAGLGLAIIPLQSLELEQADGVLALLNITGFPVQRDWNVVSLRNRPLSPAAEALSRHLRSVLPSRGEIDDCMIP
jgi:DNA-binding transcriptional LysR family regulator